MTLALASGIGAQQVPGVRLPALGKMARGVVGVSALVLGSAILLSATATASSACSGPVLVAEAIVLPDLSRTT